jgi:hypothetical protein
VVLQTCSDSVSWKGSLKHDGDMDHYELRPGTTTASALTCHIRHQLTAYASSSGTA